MNLVNLQKLYDAIQRDPSRLFMQLPLSDVEHREIALPMNRDYLRLLDPVYKECGCFGGFAMALLVQGGMRRADASGLDFTADTSPYLALAEFLDTQEGEALPIFLGKWRDTDRYAPLEAVPPKHALAFLRYLLDGGDVFSKDWFVAKT